MVPVIQPTAWVVDDDVTTRDLLAIALGDHFEIQQATSGEEILERLVRRPAPGQAAPSLVLLDIEMDTLDGYRTCQRLRKAGLDIPVLFISSHDTLEERLLAFDAGGDDFISKPFEPDVVLVKAQLAHARLAEIRRIEAEKSLLQETTSRILHQVGETGVLLDFLRQSMRVADYQSLARELMQTVSDYGIQCHVQIRHGEEALTLTPAGMPSALELSILEHAATLGSQFRLGKRLILNSEQVSLLVINMPRDESEALRLTGYLEVLVESAQAMAETIDMRQESAARAEALMVGSLESYCSLTDLRLGYSQQQIDTRLLFHQMIDEVEKTYIHLGLTDRQEATVSETIRHSADKILKLFELGVNIDRQFTAVLDSMKPKTSNTPEVWI